MTKAADLFVKEAAEEMTVLFDNEDHDETLRVRSALSSTTSISLNKVKTTPQTLKNTKTKQIQNKKSCGAQHQEDTKRLGHSLEANLQAVKQHLQHDTKKNSGGARQKKKLEKFGPEYLSTKAGMSAARFIPLVISRDVGFWRPDVFDESECYRMGTFAAAGWEMVLGWHEALQGESAIGRWNWKNCYDRFTELAEHFGFLSLWKLIQGDAFVWNFQVFEHQCCEFRKCVRPLGNRGSKGAYDADDPERAEAYMRLWNEFASPGGALETHKKAREAYMEWKVENGKQ